MANFVYFNIQLLPIEKGIDYVGEEGYQRLWERVKKDLSAALQAKQLPDIAAKLRGDMYFAPFNVGVKGGVASGQFIKFDHIDSLKDLYSGDVVQKVGWGKSSQRYPFDFVFDCKRHVLAISQRQRLPAFNPLIDALQHLLSGPAEDLFPKHNLTVNSLTEADSLKPVWDARGYLRLEVEVTFSNSDEFDDEEIAELEKELREKHVHGVDHVEKAAKGSAMSGITKMGKTLLGLATSHGDAMVRYVKGNGDRETYHMKQFPVRLEVTQEPDETEVDYFRKITQSIARALARSKSGT